MGFGKVSSIVLGALPLNYQDCRQVPWRVHFELYYWELGPLCPEALSFCEPQDARL